MGTTADNMDAPKPVEGGGGCSGGCQGEWREGSAGGDTGGWDYRSQQRGE